MKNTILRSTIALAALAMTLASCDDIELNDRVVKGPINEYDRTFETSEITVDGETFTIDDEHKMLIMDFTGYLCINCPTVAEFLTTKITPVYPSILVSMHMTTNSFSANNLDGYNCASADSIANWLYGNNIASTLPLPSVSIDNMDINGSVFNSNITDLENLAVSRFKMCNIDKTVYSPVISLKVENLGDGKYDIGTLVIYHEGRGMCDLRLWLIEENLVSTLQASTTGYILNYENHGILREVINGSYMGQRLHLNPQGQAVVHNTLDISQKGYNPDNLYVVGLVTTTSGEVIMNSNKIKL